MLTRFKTYWAQSAADWNYIFLRELKNVFRDGGVLIFLVLLPLFYPLLYTYIYTPEVIRDVPIAVVDESHTRTSREYLRRIDATAEVRIVDYAPDMEAAKRLVKERSVYGIVHLPADFSRRLNRGQQVNVNIYADMSGLLYYKAILTANTNVSLALNANIKAVRSQSTTAQQEAVAKAPIAYQEVSIFNPQAGFATFLIPGVLMLILQQALLLGIGLAAGTERERGRFRELTPVNRHYRGLLRIVFGKAWAYLLIFVPAAVWVLGCVPHMFQLPQLGSPVTLALFVVPYLLACIFFAMTISGLVRERESVMLLVVFTSLPLLFISGISWPGSAIPAFWKVVSFAFPSTVGINGFVRINNTGAWLGDVATEWHVLWAQAVVYFFTTCLVYKASIAQSRRRFIAQYRAARRRRHS